MMKHALDQNKQDEEEYLFVLPCLLQLLGRQLRFIVEPKPAAVATASIPARGMWEV